VNKTKYLLNLKRIASVVVFLIGIIGIVLPCVVGDKLPGDDGDSRFNLYILEHFYLVMSGKEASFVDGPFFYPWIKTILFSDTHWGTGFVYAFFRLLHLSQEKSFASWFLIGFVLNYWSAYFVNRKLGLQNLGAAIGAFIFTFSLPLITQFGHEQLIYRFYVPLAIFTSYKYFESKDPRYAATTVFFLGLQLMISVYSGLFLGYFLFGYLLSIVFLAISAEKTVPGPRSWFSSILPSKDLQRSTWAVTGLVLIISISIIVLVVLPYFKAQQLYGFKRSWWEIKSMLPRIQSYFIGDNSRLWFSNGMKIFQVPMRHEHNMFIGLGSALTLLFGLREKKLLRKNKLILAFIITIGILVALTLNVGGMTIYRIMAILPGISSIRAVSRIILILIFPVGFIVGYTIDNSPQKHYKLVSSSIIVSILMVLILADSVLAHRLSTSIIQWNSRLQQLESKISQPLDKDSILVVASQDPDYLIELDAMLFAQRKGIKTLNGYSGNAPPGWFIMKTCNDVKQVISAANLFSNTMGDNGFGILDPKKMVFVGFEKNCHDFLQ
jgi:hypothetical protein